ncbi:MAG: SBBP repeat-containing protein [Pseudomonadota bacterium]
MPDRDGLAAAQQARVAQDYGKLPLYFIANQGQKAPQVRYYAEGGGGGIFFRGDEVTLVVNRSGNDGPSASAGHEPSRPPRPSHETHSGSQEGAAPVVLHWKPLGIRPEVEVTGTEPQEGKVNYLVGNDPAQWHRGIPTWGAVLYRGAWPGIDLKFYGNGREFEYDAVVAPGADPGRARFQYEGAESLALNAEGELVITLPGGGRLIQKRPVVYQEINGRRVGLEGGYRLEEGSSRKDTYGFTLAAYDPCYPLVIDPVTLGYSTYLGGSNYDSGWGIAVDAAGCAYVTGITRSGNFPTQNPFDNSYNGGFNGDAFVTKLSAAGDTLVYSTYLGGSSDDEGNGIAVDAAGCAYVTGATWSDDFPILNPYQTDQPNNEDAFVTKLSAAGDTLVYSTYLGGNGQTEGNDIAVDAAGCAYVTGLTSSNNFPTVNPYQVLGSGAFVTKFSAAGDTLVYSTYLGGGASGALGRGIAVDGSGCAYVTGVVRGGGFPTKNPFDNSYNGGNYDVFVTKFSAAGDALVYSTYLGGALDDEVYHGIAVDGSGCAYVTGWTYSNNFPILNPYQTDQPGVDAFVTKFSAAGDTLVYSTYLGGSSMDWGYGIAVDGGGCAWITGDTFADNFPLQNPFDDGHDFSDFLDVFVTKLSAAGNSLVYSTLLGGSDFEGGRGIAVDGDGCAYVTGVTYNWDFPTLNPYQANNKGWSEAFVTKFKVAPPGCIQEGSYNAPLLFADSTMQSQHGDDLYFSYYRSSSTDWTGNLKRYKLAYLPNTCPGGGGKEWIVADKSVPPVRATNCSDEFIAARSSAWSTADGGQVNKGGVGEVLHDSIPDLPSAAPYTRAVYTLNGVNFKAFNGWVNKARLGVGTNAEVDRIINYVYGFTYDRAAGGEPVAKRAWQLGDIQHSEPIVIDYFSAAAPPVWQKRLLAVGANDGMLHVFDDADGKEKLAFVPDNLLTRLQDFSPASGLAGDARYFVDGPLALYSQGSDKILIFGEGRGGRVYYALNASDQDPTKWTVRWSKDSTSPGFAELGQTWSKPQLANLANLAGGTTPVAIFGGGYDLAEDHRPPGTRTMGRAVYVVNVKTGALIYKFTNANLQCVPGSVSVINKSVTNDNKNLLRCFYFCDTGGRVWKTSYNSATNNFSTSAVFKSWGGVKMFYPPDVSLGNKFTDNPVLYVGTGDPEHILDTTSVWSDRMYCIVDSSGPCLSEADLEDVTNDSLENPLLTAVQKEAIRTQLRTKAGWYIQLGFQDPAADHLGEKVLGQPVVFDGVVYFSTWTPDAVPDPCNPEGHARTYALDYSSAISAYDYIDDGLRNGSDRQYDVHGVPPSPVQIILRNGEAGGFVNIGLKIHPIGRQSSAIRQPSKNMERLLWYELNSKEPGKTYGQ